MITDWGAIEGYGMNDRIAITQPNIITTTGTNLVFEDHSCYIKTCSQEPDKTKAKKLPDITKVVFNRPATIVFWDDGTKTIVKCDGEDIYSEEVGIAMCIAKKALGNKSNYNNVIKKWTNK